MDWLSELPEALQSKIVAITHQNPTSQQVFTELYQYLSDNNKRRKIGHDVNTENGNGSATGAGAGGHEELTPSSSIHPDSVIFEIQQVSFSSPLRKRMNLTFHLIEQNGEPIPVMSIVNPANNAPELSFINLKHAVRLCLALPILGNSTNSQKKGIAMLCFWIHDHYYTDPNVSKDPIICQLNLDMIKKQMIKNGKLPSDIESQFDLSSYKNEVVLNPIQERIIDYFKRQFQLVGINLINYLPCSSIFHNKYIVNEDTAVALTSEDGVHPKIIMVECHKGARDGNLIFLEQNEYNAPYVIFAFKKPILVFKLSKVLRASYTSITKHTFSLNIVVLNDRDEERPMEFSMIDQAYFNIIDNFIRLHGISDDSYNSVNKEKNTGTGGADANEAVGAGAGAADNEVDDDDDDEDADFEGNDDGSDVAEEYDSAAGSADEDASGAEGEDDDVENDEVFTRSKEE
ncbi:RTT106 [Candida theae]|uniref:Histone chaperone RTT106 n=1 Tax=Candida theae TaxID=1198502 RepID=A0AAD5G0E2_9ASCO|nr:RTT106 [Candida theae]KAI5964554.1 RTT106 [Candida theae]